MIIFDAGHGGKDPGAVDPKEKKQDDEIYIDKFYTEESKLVLEFTKLLKEMAEFRGFESLLTRDKEEYISLKERANMANEMNAGMFVSIHANAAANENAHGIETLHYPNSKEGIKLADKIQKRMIEESGARNRGLKARGDVYVLRKTTMPAVLVELGFITNKEEEEKLNDANYRIKLANAILDGIKDYAIEFLK